MSSSHKGRMSAPTVISALVGCGDQRSSDLDNSLDSLPGDYRGTIVDMVSLFYKMPYKICF